MNSEKREGRVVARIQIPEDAENVEVKPYTQGSHECCCGNPDCTDFEDRMAAWGIPLDELTTVTYEQRLRREDD